MIENKELKVDGKKKRWVWEELEREDEYDQNMLWEVLKELKKKQNKRYRPWSAACQCHVCFVY